MAFHLSPASSIDQLGSDYPSLLLLPSSASTTSYAAAQAFGNFTLALPLNTSVPQIFVVNPTSDNVFRHINAESAHAAIIGLIYFSMWMGVLGWDIVSTVHFDIRLIKETTWSSSFSSIYSLAYLLSRYVSLSWLVTAVTNSVIMTNRCDAWMKGSTALFSIGISATMLVFCLRTCSIWHMRQRIVSLVVTSWLLVVAFAVLLPIMSYGDQLSTSNFCSWHFHGLYVVGVFGALLLFDLLCLILTVCRLNKAGWRGLLRGIFPSNRHNLDAEDVKTMLVQKTTAFFVIQFLFLISALLVYVLTDTYAYRMMNIVASVAVASSMAGRIFRRAWRQTRELAPHNFNRPPSYFPAWAEEHPDARLSRQDDSASCSPGADAGRSPRNKDKHDSMAFYVEGEYGPKPKPRSASCPSLRSLPRRPSSSRGARQMREMESGQIRVDPDSEAIGIAPDTLVIARTHLTLPIPAASIQSPAEPLSDSLSLHGGPAPAYLRDLGAASSSRPPTAGCEPASLPASDRHSSAGELSSAQTASHSPASTSQLQLITAISDNVVSRNTPSHASFKERSVPAMEERRRSFVTSPPLSAGIRLSSKEVFDFDAVKAAAWMGRPPLQTYKPARRPATASLLSHAPSFQIAVSGSSSRGLGQKDDARGSDFAPPALYSEGPSARDSRTPRPKTAPSWPSPSLSPSPPESTQTTFVAQGLGAAHLSSTTSEATHAADDDVLLAFLNTVEQDSRDHMRLNSLGQCESEGAKQDADGRGSEGGRPRTARGNTASSGHSDETDEGGQSDRNTIVGHGPSIRGRLAPDDSKQRLGTSDSSGSGTSSAGTRPSTAAGGAVKPFGFGTLTTSSRMRPFGAADGSYMSDDEDGHAEAELGSVIQEQYAKLAARAQMPLDPQC